LLPECFAVNLQLKNHQSGDTLREALFGRENYGTREHVVPGPQTYDGSYTELLVEWKGIRVRVQSAASNDQLFLCVTPLDHLKGDTLFIDPQMLWGRQGNIIVRQNEINVHTPSRNIRLTVTGGNYTATAKNIKFSLEKSIGITTDGSKSIKEIEAIINQAKIKFETGKARYENVSEVYNAQQTVLAWNVIYEPVKKRVIVPVSRNWSVDWKGWVLFEWDTYFSAYMLSMENKDLAYANAIAITKEITASGFVPNCGSAVCASEDRSQPPVGAFTVKEIYHKYKEKWLLQEVFDDLLTWNRWWTNNRDVQGYLCWGSDPYTPGKIPAYLIKGIGTRKGAKWESGMDNSPMWDDAVYDTVTHRLLLADVGLISFYIVDCRSLAEIANELGKPDIAKELIARADKYAKKLETLWDDQFGLYLNKDLVTAKFSHRLSPTLFYPLLTKVPNQHQASRMMKEHFYNPDEFWGEYIMPSIARNDSAYKDNKYWRGRIWAPLNLLVYMGIRNYDLPDARKDMVAKSKNLLMKSWMEEHHVYENYNADTGSGHDAGMSDAFYHWGALLGFIELIDKGYVKAPEFAVKK
jgi:putative isomerase